MSKIYRVLAAAVLALGIFAVSCSPDSNGGSVVLRDYQEQYQRDIDTIDYFLDHYSMEVSPDFDVTFTKITAQTSDLIPIRNQTEYPLQFKMIHVDEHNEDNGGIDYKVYYINFREGVNNRPSPVDSVYVSYKGHLINSNAFDQADAPTWLPLHSTIKGWQEIIPMFKTGFYTDGGPNPDTFTDFGSGLFFLPSGLGYYGQNRPGIPSYSTLIFSFKLYELDYVDHDRDGILSKDELDIYNFPAETDLRKVDTDGDGTINALDIDDDGDTIMTKHEVHFDSSGNLIFEDCDGDGIPNYLDPDSNGQTCN